MNPIITVEEYRLIMPLPKKPEIKLICSFEDDSNIITTESTASLILGLEVIVEGFAEDTIIEEILSDTQIKVSSNSTQIGEDVNIEFYGINKAEDEMIQMYIDIATEYLLSLCDNNDEFIKEGYPYVFKLLLVKAVYKISSELTRDRNIQSESIARYSVSFRNSFNVDLMFDESDLKVINKHSRMRKITFKSAYK